MDAISIARIEAAAEAINPVFLHSPQFRSEGLSERIGAEVTCKVETINPLGCFKGRGVAWLFNQRPHLERVVCASAGNFGRAVAYMGRDVGVAVEVFAAATANSYKVNAIEQLGARVYLVGNDLDEAKDAARDYALSSGANFIEDGAEAELSEGAGTAARELASTHLDRIYLPLGNGALLCGWASWLNAKCPDTKIIGVCAEGAPAMYRSWLSGRVIETPSADTIADGVAVRIPVAQSTEIVCSGVSEVVLVSEAENIKGDEDPLRLRPVNRGACRCTFSCRGHRSC